MRQRENPQFAENARLASKTLFSGDPIKPWWYYEEMKYELIVLVLLAVLGFLAPDFGGEDDEDNFQESCPSLSLSDTGHENVAPSRDRKGRLRQSAGPTAP